MKPSSYFNLITRLNSLRSYHTQTRMFYGSLIILSVIFAYLLLSFILSYLSGFILPVFIRVALLGIFLLALSIALSYYLLRPLFYKPTLEDLAVRIEGKFPQLNNRLIGALQLYRNLERNPEGYSVQMIEAIIEQADTVAGEMNFKSVVDKRPLRKTLQVSSALLGLVLIFTFLFPGHFNRSLYLFSHPLTSVQAPQRFFFSISPGNAEVVKYSNVKIEITAEGQKPSKISFYWRDGEGAWNEERLEKLDQGGAKGQLQDTVGTSKEYDFEYLFKQAKRDIDYYAQAEGIKSEQYKLKVTDKPRIINLKLTLNYPKYTQLKPLVLDQNDGNIEALAGTKVKIEASANKELSRGNLVFSDSSKTEMKIDGKKATGEILVRKDDTYHLEVEDKSGNKNPDPIEYKITKKDDLSPQVEIIQPGEDRDLTENMQLPLLIHGSDDFGFTGLRLVYQISSKGEQTKNLKLPFEEKLEGELSSDYLWDLSNLGLMPGDNVKYWVEIYDNDNFSGPKKGVSQSYNLRHPTLAEIVGEIEQGSENQLSDLQKKLAEQKELQKKLEQLSKDLLTESTNPQGKGSKLSWEKKNELENLLQKQKDLAESLKKLGEEAGKTADKIEQNNLASLEMLEKIAELKKLFEEVAPPELKEAMRKLQEALESLDKDKIKEALQNLNLSTEELLKRLDRTIAMLKQMRIEQRMEDLVKLTERLTRDQENLNKEIEEAKKEELSSLKEKQDDLKKGTEGLEKKLQELNELMKETPLLSSEDMDTLMNSVEKSGVKNDMEKTSQSLQQGQKSESLKSGKTCSNKLSNLSLKFQSMLQKMKQGDKEQILADMRKSLQDILYLSDSQESLFEDTKTFQPRETGLANLAAQEQKLMEGLNQVGSDLKELAKKTFYINPDLGEKLSLASVNMLQAIGRLEELDGNRSLNYQFESLFNLNQAAKSLLEGVENARKSCSNPDAFAQLQGMCQKQGTINDQSVELSELGMYTMEQQAGLARLAAEQQALKENLERLNQESSNRSQILGSLDDIAQDMQKVVEDLERMKVDQKTIDRQKQILSRLLDSEKSLVKRDYSEKRKAETGEDITRKSPFQLPANIGALDQKERERAQRLSTETYPKEYEEAIKEYFKALSEPEKK
ncbi:MAG: hypothetical protein MUP17_07690 [candidate division Zixibacteria bacterium]|nr:hypothetical protein [candidate division Zixibacteria bacterium]